MSASLTVPRVAALRVGLVVDPKGNLHVDWCVVAPGPRLDRQKLLQSSFKGKALNKRAPLGTLTTPGAALEPRWGRAWGRLFKRNEKSECQN